MATSGKEIVVCLGSSTTASKGTYKWIEELARRPQNQKYRFVNLGVGGDLSFNAVQRLQQVVAANPDRVIVLLGANDILATVFPNVRRFFGGWKKLPHDPSPAWFKQNLETIVTQLKRQTSARIALVSLSLVGEAPHSTEPIQSQLNQLFQQYNAVIKRVAERGKLDYIPFAEAFMQELEASPGQSFHQFRFRSFYRDYVLREFILHRSFDDISSMNGWKFHIDGVHLNTAGGRILVEAVQEFLAR